MNLSLLSDHDLHERTLQSATTEKSATLVLLEHLAEVDERMLYAKRGYSSLWEYVHQALGYSESQASERVNSMRLMRKIPEVKTAIENGAMTLTATSKLATFLKREKPDPEKTMTIVKECEQKTTRQVEKILLSHASQPEALPFSPNAEKMTVLGDSLSKIQFTADEELCKLFERAKELSFRHETGFEFREIVKIALKEFIQKREIKTTSKVIQPQPQKTADPSSRSIPQSIKITVRSRAQDQCEFIDPTTQRRCCQRSHLEFDHIHPFAKGGATTAENIRYYCRIHNRLHAIQSYGKKKIMKYIQR